MISLQKCTILVLVLSVILSLSSINVVAAEKVFKLGVDGPFTGPTARTGAEMKAAVEAAFDAINYKIGEYKVELVYIDSDLDPVKATNAYTEAIERHGVQAVTSNWQSSCALAVMDIAAQYKVPHFFGVAASSAMNEKFHSDRKYYGYYTKVWVVPTRIMAGYVECLNNAIQKGLWKPEKKLVALIAEDTDWGRDVGRGFKKYFTQTGWQIASEDYVGTSQTEFYPVLNKYKQSGVSVIAGSIATQASVAAYAKQARELGIDAVMVDDGLGWFGEWYKLTGDASNYLVDMNLRFTTPKAKEWAKSFEAKYKIAPGAPCGGLIFDATNFFIKAARRAIEKYRTLDKESLHKIMVEEIYTGKLTYGRKDGALVMQELRYDAESIPDAVFGQDAWFLPIVQYMNGNAVIVYPENIKEKDFVPPPKNK